jgi:hypothetical protein
MGLSTVAEKASSKTVRQIGLKLDAELIGWLEECARREDRALAYIVRRILIEKKTSEERAAARTKKPKSG